jgi:hypothetical protein
VRFALDENRIWRDCQPPNHEAWGHTNPHVSAPEGYRQKKVAPAEASATKLLKVLFIRDYFGRWLARFELGAHFLNLSCLLFELRSKNLHLFLLQGDS